MLNYVKRLNEIKISVYKIACFITVTFKNKFGSPTAKSSKSLFTDNSFIGHFIKAATKVSIIRKT